MKNFIRRSVNLMIFTFLLFALYSCNMNKESTENEKDHFRVITYNVWYGFTKVPDRKELWLNWMKEQDPDVVSLQELNEYTPQQLQQDAEKWGHEYTVLLKMEGFPTGVTSRYPIEDIQKFMEGFHHGLMRVKIQDIYFYIIHLHPGNWEVREREINLILEDIESLPQNAKIILAGDFNNLAPVDSVFYQHGRLEPFFHQRDIEHDSKNLKEGKLYYSAIDRLVNEGFTDLEYIFRPGNYEFKGTFPTDIEKEGDDGDNRRLDYIFVSRNLSDKAVSARIIRNDTTLIMSDHLPVIADFNLE